MVGVTAEKYYFSEMHLEFLNLAETKQKDDFLKLVKLFISCLSGKNIAERYHYKT